MAILEKEVWVVLGSKNINYYKNKGYDLPLRTDKWGNISVERGSKILVRIDDIPLNCNVQVTKICDECGEKTPNQTYKSMMRRRTVNDGIDRCHKCGLKIGALKRKHNVKFENSLEYWAKQNNKEHLLEEFSNKNKKIPSQISHGSDDLYLWNCPICKSEYEAKVCMRTTNKSNCLYCSGHKVNETNCLNTTHPKLSKEWHPIRNGDLTPYQVTKGNEIKVWWICSNNHEWYAKVSNRANGRCCPYCNESKGEKEIREWLEEKNVEYEHQKEFYGLVGLKNKPLSYDFYLINQNLLIEYQGEFHDGSSGNFSRLNLKNQQEHDKRKREFSKRNKIELLEIWYWDFENIKSILENEVRGKFIDKQS